MPSTKSPTTNRTRHRGARPRSGGPVQDARADLWGPPPGPRTAGMERRRAPRAPGGFTVAISTPLCRQAVPVLNISTAGVSCQLPFPVPVLTQVRVDLELPAGPLPGGPRRRIACEGAVVRCEPAQRSRRKAFEIAIFFTALTPDGRAAIQRFVAARLAARPD